MNLNLKLTNLNANLVGSVFLFFYLKRSFRSSVFCLRDGLSQRLGVCLRQRRAILEPRRPLKRLLVQSIVALVQRVYAKPDYLKRVRCLFSSSKLLVQLRQTPLKLCLARSHARCALFCNSKVRFCIRKLSVSPTLSANGILMLILQLFELRS